MKKHVLQVTAYLDFLLDWLWVKHRWLSLLVAVSSCLSLLVELVADALQGQWGPFAEALVMDVLVVGGVVLLLRWAARERLRKELEG